MPDALEFRCGLELRAAGRRLIGLAAPYDQVANIGPFREVIRRGAWAATLASSRDVVALQDHDGTRLLGRRSSGTLTLADDQRGLVFTLDVADTAAGRDVLALAARQDLGGVSVGMRVIDQAWSGDLREIRAADLIELSIVSAFPAYSGTEIALRARDQTTYKSHFATYKSDPAARRRLLDML